MIILPSKHPLNKLIFFSWGLNPGHANNNKKKANAGFNPKQEMTMKRTYLCFIFLMTMLLKVPAFSKNMEGTVMSLREGRLIIDIWGGNLTEDFKITPTTKLQYLNSLDDLRLGDKVHIYYRGEG